MTVRFRNDALAVTRERYSRYGPAVMQKFGPFQSLALFGPDAMQFVLTDRDENLSAQRAWELIMGRIFGGGLLLRDGENHRQHRKIMLQAFRKSAYRAYLDLMNPQISGVVASWTRRPNRFEAFPELKRLTLGLAASVFVGTELGPRTDALNRAFEHTVAASMSLIRLPIPGLEFQRGLAGRRTMSAFFRALLPERRRTPGSDMLSRLCMAETEAGERFSDDEIIDHMNFLMMAAHDTTTSSLTSILYCLAKYPEWQERVRRESLALGSEYLAFDDLGRLTSLSLVMQEVLRRYPPLSSIPRVALRACEFDGYRIPAGAMVTVFPLHTHHMEEWWTDPFQFDPERFSPGREEHKRHSHLYAPFGGGAHVCLGRRFAEMQIKAVVHQLVQRLRWEVADGYEMPVQEAPISKPRDGLPLAVIPLA